MQGYNVLLILSQDERQVLMCERSKPPYQGMLNLVGGKIEPGEDGLHAAYRELQEETGITRDAIALHQLLRFEYSYEDCWLEAYVGRLSQSVKPSGEENPLVWVSAQENFFDLARFAGMGNIGHMMEQYRAYRERIFIDEG